MNNGANLATGGDLAPVERRSISDEVVYRLGEYIMQRGLRPGEKLPAERELMEYLRVGRSSLREAIKALRAVGAIDVVAGGGMYVGRGGTTALHRPLSWAVFLNSSSLLQATEARMVLESELAALAAERITDEELERLHECLQRMRTSTDSSFLTADVDFHLTVGKAARNDILYSALDMLQIVIRGGISRILRKAKGEPVSLEEHEAIYEALVRHDPESARRWMRAHIEAATRRLMAASEFTDDSLSVRETD